MTNKELTYLGLQVVCILIFMAWICLLIIRIRKQRYGYWYVIIRALCCNDSKPLEWLKSNTVYVWYLIQLMSLVFLNVGLIEEIAEDTVFTKSWSFFLGNLMLGISALFINVKKRR